MKLRTRVIIGVAVVSATISAGFLASGALIADRARQDFLSLAAHSQEAAAWSVLRRSEAAFKRHARTIAREHTAIRALAERRDDALRDNIASTFNRIAATGDITHMAMYRADGALAVGFPEG